MPFCPVCRFEYRPGFTECADCGAALVENLAAGPQPSPAGSGGDVVVARVHGQALAQMWAELLGNQGIASRMNPITGVADTVYPTDTVYEVRVAAAAADRARAILPPPPGAAIIRDLESPPSDDDDLLDQVDFAIATGDLELADSLLSSIENREQD